MRRSDLVRNAAKGKTVRTSQIVFGERQHLLRVLDSVERSALPAARLDQERRVIEQLIHSRTQELNRINPFRYLRDVLIRIQTHPRSRIDELLPHRWAEFFGTDSS